MERPTRGGRDNTNTGESMDRPSWDTYFIRVAQAVALRGDCRRSQVGAVLVEDRTHRILSTGYNGVEPNVPGCLSGACPRGLLSYGEQPPGGNYDNCIGIHAEDNCISWWIDWFNYEDSQVSMFITREPCDGCLSLMREYRVRRVVWGEFFQQRYDLLAPFMLRERDL